MKTIRFREVDREAWDRVAERSPQAWLTHRYPWIEIEERFFVSGNLSFALEEGSELVGIQPLFLNERSGMAFGERLLHSGIHRHTGLAFRADIDASLAKAVRQAAMQEILGLAELYDVDRIQLNSHNLAPANRRGDGEVVPFWVRDFGFQLGIAFGQSGMMPSPGVSTLNADQLVDLGPKQEELFANLDPSCRTAIRKAEKSKLRFEISNDPSNLNLYADLAESSAARTGEALPPVEYYRSIFDAFGSAGSAHVAFARNDEGLVAGLLLLSDKNAVNFLAGVSLPDAIKFRPNDFLHWNAIVWAKRAGFEVYRFGPWFPEVPREWPISKVSFFKTKFGSRSLPIIQGSLFRHPELYTSNMPTYPNHLSQIGVPTAEGMTAGKAGAFVAHHLHTFGFPKAMSMPDGEPVVLYHPDVTQIASARSILEKGGCIVAVLPSVEFSKAFGVGNKPRTTNSPRVFHGKPAGSKPWRRLRTLHSYMCFVTDAEACTIVEDSHQEAVWLHRSLGSGGSIVFVGTDLASDLQRFRQGDPAAARNRPTESMWGVAGERPNYLFEAQLAGEDLTERPADWWCEALCDSLTRLCGQSRQPMLPNGAPGAIIVTGDDDQAGLNRYAQQREALGALPVTYFLHPLTKHSRASLNRLKRGRRVELGLHPDALDQSDKYAELFAEQARWFRRLTGQNTRTVRNHGFLNDGYWGHEASWKKHGVIGSSNLPGLDGRIINGSLLPARLLLNDELTDHWSILTAIGDGIVFIHGWDDVQSAQCVLDLAGRIKVSGVPGVMVLNLHPENIEKTRGMHEAVRKIVQDGFIPWTMSECFDWFGAHVQSTSAPVPTGKRSRIADMVRRMFNLK